MYRFHRIDGSSLPYDGPVWEEISAKGIHCAFKGTLTFFALRNFRTITHCYHVNDFPVVNGTPGIIQDPIDLLLAKSNFTNKWWMVLVFSTCNTIHLLLVKLHFVNKRRMVLVFSTCNTIHLLLVKLHLLFLIFH